MGNRDTKAILDYHEATKHSESSIRASRHTLDWENQPVPFKIYRDLESIPLVKDFHARDLPALAAIAGGADALDMEALTGAWLAGAAPGIEWLWPLPRQVRSSVSEVGDNHHHGTGD